MNTPQLFVAETNVTQNRPFGGSVTDSNGTIRLFCESPSGNKYHPCEICVSFNFPGLRTTLRKEDGQELAKAIEPFAKILVERSESTLGGFPHV